MATYVRTYVPEHVPIVIKQPKHLRDSSPTLPFGWKVAQGLKEYTGQESCHDSSFSGVELAERNAMSIPISREA